jgi:hypothetical protein
MKRYSAYFLFSLIVVVAYVGFDYYLCQRLWKEEYRTEFALKVERLEDEAFLAGAYLKATDNTEQLYQLLDSRAKGRNIDFWVLYHRNKLYKTSLETWQLEKLAISDEDLKILNVPRMLDGVHHSFLASDLGNHFTLFVGKTYDLDRYLAFQLDKRIEAVLHDILIVCFVAIALFSFFFRDIAKSIRLLTSGKKRDFKTLNVHSKEAELIVRGLSAYEDHTTQLTLEKDILSWQVLPALRTELMSGKAPPYDFHCTLVRTDINNFSKIYNEYPVADFTSTINDFFTDVTHVVSRYGGLIHEFIGDEVIYYFKDEDVGNSTAMAMSAIRDINAVAVLYNRQTTKERGYAFTVKSTFAEGKIQFRRFVNGYNLAGAVLIETVRILSHVHEKSGNVVVFNSRHEPQLKQLAHSEHFANVHLKGYQDEQQLSIYQGHRELAEVLHSITESEKQVSVLSYYRSDADLVQILQWLSAKVLKGQYSLAQKVLSVLRDMRVTRVDFAVPITLAEWLENLLQRIDRVESQDRDQHIQLISSAIRLIENLIPLAQFDERLEAICKQAAQVKNRRLIANALDVLTVMKSKAEPEFSKRLLNHEDNRVAANALVHEGTRAITPLVLKRLRKMLSSKEELFVASALYALGEIAGHHKERDPIYYQTQIDLLTIVSALPGYIKEPSEMVRKQALIAARKVDNEKVLSEIGRIVAASGSSQLANEVSLHLGERSPTASVVPLRRSA